MKLAWFLLTIAWIFLILAEYLLWTGDYEHSRTFVYVADVILILDLVTLTIFVFRRQE